VTGAWGAVKVNEGGGGAVGAGYIAKFTGAKVYWDSIVAEWEAIPAWFSCMTGSPRLHLPVVCSAALLLSAGCRGSADRMEHHSQHTSSPAQRVGSLALLSPQAGDTLVEGETYVIRWSAPAGMRIDLGAAMGGKDKGMLLVGAPAQPESLVWKLPVGFVTGFGVASSDQVHLRLEDADSAAHYVEAGPFTVRGVGRR